MLHSIRSRGPGMPLRMVGPGSGRDAKPKNTKEANSFFGLSRFTSFDAGVGQTRLIYHRFA